MIAQGYKAIGKCPDCNRWIGIYYSSGSTEQTTRPHKCCEGRAVVTTREWKVLPALDVEGFLAGSEAG